MERPDDAVRLAHVLYARNFAINLESIAAFWAECGFPAAYDHLLDSLTDTVVPNLQRHPGIGRPFMDRAADSVEVERVTERLSRQLSSLAQGARLREYVMDDYVVLYVESRRTIKGRRAAALIVELLAIKHQKQFGYEIPAQS
jgi:hypothetical protein